MKSNHDLPSPRELFILTHPNNIFQIEAQKNEFV